MVSAGRNDRDEHGTAELKEARARCARLENELLEAQEALRLAKQEIYRGDDYIAWLKSCRHCGSMR